VKYAWEFQCYRDDLTDSQRAQLKGNMPTENEPKEKTPVPLGQEYLVLLQWVMSKPGRQIGFSSSGDFYAVAHVLYQHWQSPTLIGLIHDMGLNKS
jgi:hypothetical protein